MTEWQGKAMIWLGSDKNLPEAVMIFSLIIWRCFLLYLPWSQVRNDQLVLTEAASPWERCKIAELQCTPRSLGLLSPFIQPGDDDNGDDLYIMLMWHLFVCHVLSSCHPYIMLNWRLTWRPALPWIGKPKAPELSPLKKPIKNYIYLQNALNPNCSKTQRSNLTDDGWLMTNDN